jgi:hypothetical protein
MEWDNKAGFTGRRAGDAVTFEIRDNIGPGLGLIEVIPSAAQLGFVGTATGAIAGPAITATFSGTLSLYTDPPRGWAQLVAACRADDHRMEFVRIGGR